MTRDEREAIFRIGIHNLMCAPYEVMDDGRYRRRNDLRPAIGGEGCICGDVPCPPEPVPAATAIRTRSVPNVPTGRLLVRLEFLRQHIRRASVWAEQKSDFRARVREVVNVERELHARGKSFVPVTDGRHLGR